MKIHTALATNPDAEKASADIIKELQDAMDAQPVDLLSLFVTPHYAEAAQTVLTRLRQGLAPRHLLGGTGISVVSAGREIENRSGMAVFAASLPGVEIDAFRLTIRQVQDRYVFRDFPERIDDTDARRALLLMADPFTTPMRDLLDQTNADFEGLPVIGGLCSGGHGPGQNKLFLDDEVGHVGVVGVLLSGNLEVDTIVSQGCKPVGNSYLITEVENNVILSLGRRPALARLKEVFEGASEADQKLIQTTLNVGVAMNEYQDNFHRGDFLIRNIMGIDPKQGAIAMMGAPRVGQTMQFHVRDAGTASEDLDSLLADHAKEKKQYDGALLFTCNGRGKRFFGKPNHDIDALKEHVGDIPTAGFFAAGEIGPVRGKAYVHGYTASFGLFRQPDGGE